MLVQTIPGTAGLSIPGAPVVPNVAYEKTLARVLQTGDLLCDPSNTAADRWSGAETWFAGSHSPVANRSAMNNQLCWHFDGTMNCEMEPGFVSNSYTILFVMERTAAAAGDLFRHSDNYGCGFFHDADTHRFWANVNNINAFDQNEESSEFLAPGETGFFGVSFDATSDESVYIGKTGALTSQVFTHNGSPDIEGTNGRFMFGKRLSSNEAGYVGDIIRTSLVLHDPANAQILADLTGAMAAKYGLA
jgi:hypothetical protein